MYKTIISIALILCCSRFACALQEHSHQAHSDLALSLEGVFPGRRLESNLRRNVSGSAGGAATFRYWMSPWTGLEFNYGHTRNTQTVTTPSNTTRIHSGMHEVTGAWLLGLPAVKPFRPFLEIGGGMLQYSPSRRGSSVAGAGSQNKPAVLYGGGVDYVLSRHVALRFQYRGLLSAAPSFGVENQRTNTVSHIAQPAVGIIYQF